MIREQGINNCPHFLYWVQLGCCINEAEHGKSVAKVHNKCGDRLEHIQRQSGEVWEGTGRSIREREECEGRESERD